MFKKEIEEAYQVKRLVDLGFISLKTFDVTKYLTLEDAEELVSEAKLTNDPDIIYKAEDILQRVKNK